MLRTAVLALALSVGAGCAGSGQTSKGVCDADGCSTREKAVEAARKHADARPGHPATGVCLTQGRDGWWSWSLTGAGCELPAVWAPLR